MVKIDSSDHLLDATHFMRKFLKVSLFSTGNEVNLGPQVVTTDIDDHIDDILDCYEEGFYLNEFVKIPVVKSTTEVQDWSEKHPYQAILSKPTVR